ncbi:hypothetical protein DBR06_SOUSAS1010021, partial [Sousa chinensis]
SIAALTVRRPLQAVELLSLQPLLTLMAGKAGDVEQLPQSAHRGLSTCQGLVTPATGLWESRRDGRDVPAGGRGLTAGGHVLPLRMLHVLHQLLRQLLQLLYLFQSQGSWGPRGAHL